MPCRGFKSITVREDVDYDLRKYSMMRNKSLNQIIEDMLDEKIRLANFSKSIKIIPETVRVYT